MSERESAAAVALRFVVEADASSCLLPRLLAPFARRDLMPDAVRAQRDGDTVQVEIGLEAMPSDAVHLVAGNLRQVVGVRSLRHECAGRVLRAA